MRDPLPRMPAGAPANVIAADVPLAPLTTLGVGGSARWFIRATTADTVRDALDWAKGRALDVFVLGGGSNIVVSDEGWPGLVLQMAIAGFTSHQTASGVQLVVGAGETWDGVVSQVVSRDLAGVECLSGIPGTVGGTPVQNVGAYGQEVAAVIQTVTAIDRSSGALLRLSKAECGFGYRMSRFKSGDAGRFIVCNVTFELAVGPPTVAYPDVIEYLRQHAIMSPAVHNVRDAVLSIRRRKGMVLDEADPDTRSVGSFFVNPTVTSDTFERLRAKAGSVPPAFHTSAGHVKMPAAWLIERAGFVRGFGDGAAGVSTKHPLALVNRGGASARDVVAMATRIKREVGQRFGIWLLPEPIFVGFDGDADVDFLTRGRDKTTG